MALAEDEQVSAFKHTRVVLKAASDAAQESYAAVPMLRWHLEKSCIASIFTRILCDKPPWNHWTRRNEQFEWSMKCSITWNLRRSVSWLIFLWARADKYRTHRYLLARVWYSSALAYKTKRIKWRPGFAIQHDTLKKADLSWIGDTGIREEGHRLAGNVCGEEVAETIHDLCGEKEVTSIESSWLSKMRNLIELNAFRTFHMDHLYLTKGHLHVHVTWLSETLKLGSGDENSKCVLRCTRVEIFSSNRKQLGLWVEATMIPIYCIKNWRQRHPVVVQSVHCGFLLFQNAAIINDDPHLSAIQPYFKLYRRFGSWHLTGLMSV